VPEPLSEVIQADDGDVRKLAIKTVPSLMSGVLSSQKGEEEH